MMAFSKETNDIGVDEMDGSPINKKPRRRFSSLKQGGLDKTTHQVIPLEIKVASESAGSTL